MQSQNSFWESGCTTSTYVGCINSAYTFSVCVRLEFHVYRWTKHIPWLRRPRCRQEAADACGLTLGRKLVEALASGPSFAVRLGRRAVATSAPAGLHLKLFNIRAPPPSHHETQGGLRGRAAARLSLPGRPGKPFQRISRKPVGHPPRRPFWNILLQNFLHILATSLDCFFISQ